MLFLEGFGDVALLVLRIVLGIIFIYHGFPKLVNSALLSRMMGMSPSFVFVLGIAETLAGLASIFGIYAQVAGIVFAITMLGAIYFKIAKWNISFSSQETTGWEFDFLILASALVLIFFGAGNFSIDSMIGIWP